MEVNTHCVKGIAMESDVNPIDPAQRLRDAPRCHATAKSTIASGANAQRCEVSVYAASTGLVEGIFWAGVIRDGSTACAPKHGSTSGACSTNWCARHMRLVCSWATRLFCGAHRSATWIFFSIVCALWHATARRRLIK